MTSLDEKRKKKVFRAQIHQFFSEAPKVPCAFLLSMAESAAVALCTPSAAPTPPTGCTEASRKLIPVPDEEPTYVCMMPSAPPPTTKRKWSTSSSSPPSSSSRDAPPPAARATDAPCFLTTHTLLLAPTLREAQHKVEAFLKPCGTSPLGAVWAAAARDPLRGVSIVALHRAHRTLVGAIAGLCMAKLHRNTLVCEIYAVRAAVPRQGLGRRLLRALMVEVLQRATLRGATRACLRLPLSGQCHRNIDACLLYQSMGWVLRVPDAHGGWQALTRSELLRRRAQLEARGAPLEIPDMQAAMEPVDVASEVAWKLIVDDRDRRDEVSTADCSTSPRRRGTPPS